MRNTKTQFLSVLAFFVVAVLVLTNGFSQRIFAEKQETDVYRSIEPIGEVISEIMRSYVDEPNLDQVVEGALTGMMNSLDKHSSYIKPQIYKELTDDTKGEFQGIGVSIKLDEEQNIVVFQPLENSPAARAGVHGGDIIVEIDGNSTQGLSLAEAASQIKGPRGTMVRIKVVRRFEDNSAEPEILEFDIKRDTIPLESVSEARMLPNNIGYLRLSDFKSNSSDDVRAEVQELLDQGMRAFVLDLRWNPGGLLTASKEVCELFLPKRTLVTYTRGRQVAGIPTEEFVLRTEKSPVLPADFPLIVLVSNSTASSAEIVTGALQYHARAIVIGETTYGKGSVQTIIPLKYPEGSALRLTTALYYTPADATINERGIVPDVEVTMTKKEQLDLIRQLVDTYAEDPSLKDQQNHGSVSGNEATDDTIQDKVLQRAVEILNEDTVFTNLLNKYHKDPQITQVAAIGEDGKAVPDNTVAADDSTAAPK